LHGRSSATLQEMWVMLYLSRYLSET